jgi:hypothetical protein
VLLLLHTAADQVIQVDTLHQKEILEVVHLLISTHGVVTPVEAAVLLVLALIHLL